MSGTMIQISLDRHAPVPPALMERATDRPRHEGAGCAKGGLSGKAARRATSFLMENIGRTIRIDEIAAECGLSPGHFAKAFKVTLGKSPHRWLTEYRIACAKDLLLTSNLAIAEIAVDCGFYDQSHLTQLFADVVGMPPARWRQRHRV